jgi:membrane protease YdiL (CAAX protease family)
MIVNVFRFQFSKIRSNLITFSLIVITACGAVYVGYRHNAMPQCLAYLFVMWLCSFLIDLYALKRPASSDFPVRNPKRETMFFLLSAVLGLAFLIIRFCFDWQNMNNMVRLALMPLIVFVFPIALAVIFLLLKYKPKDLGIRLHGLLIALPIIAISALTNYLVSPGSLTWDAVVAEGGGIVGALFTGLITAGLAEEFFRVIGQTRLGSLMRNNGMGWFITTVIWALMHAPKWYGDGGDLTEALLGSIRIIPLGLMWGYLTYRTKSILPSTLVHGMNVWGLQNF